MPHESPTPGQELSQWLEEARSGSIVALGRLFEAYRPDLLKIADTDQEQLLRTKADGADLVQQSFLEAHRDWQQFHGKTPAELLAWLRQILRHNLANLSRWFHTRKHDVTREFPFSETNSSQEPTVRLTESDGSSGDGNIGGVVERILARLPEDYRRVIVLRIREDRSFAEIASLMHRSPAAVRKLLFRAMEKSRRTLERKS